VNKQFIAALLISTLLAPKARASEVDGGADAGFSAVEAVSSAQLCHEETDGGCSDRPLRASRGWWVSPGQMVKFGNRLVELENEANRLKVPPTVVVEESGFSFQTLFTVGAICFLAGAIATGYAVVKLNESK
jgi:hypothetical protein